MKNILTKRNSNIKLTMKALCGSSGMGMVLAACMAVCSIVIMFLPVFFYIPAIEDGLWVLNKMVAGQGMNTYFNGSFFAAAAELSAEDLAAVAKFMALIMVSSYALFVLIMGAYMGKKQEFEKPDTKTMLIVLALFASVNAFIEPIVAVLTGLFPSTGAETTASTALATGGGPVITVLTTAILAPIVEELVFRRGIQKNLDKVNPKASLVIATVFFAVLHGNLFQIMFAAVMGLLLGIVYQKTGNILYTCAAHILVNGTAVAIILLGLLEYELICYSVVGLITTAILLVYLYNKEGLKIFGLRLFPKQVRA
jgi:membrane protease YdiL (CAAX protease family)